MEISGTAKLCNSPSWHFCRKRNTVGRKSSSFKKAASSGLHTSNFSAWKPTFPGLCSWRLDKICTCYWLSFSINNLIFGWRDTIWSFWVTKHKLEEKFCRSYWTVLVNITMSTAKSRGAEMSERAVTVNNTFLNSFSWESVLEMTKKLRFHLKTYPFKTHSNEKCVITVLFSLHVPVVFFLWW